MKTSHGVSKNYIRSSVCLQFAMNRGKACLLLDEPKGCLDAWITDGMCCPTHFPQTIFVVNTDPHICKLMRKTTLKKLKQLGFEDVRVLCGNVYDIMRSLPKGSISAAFLDHNQTVLQLEEHPIREAISHACQSGAYVALSVSKRIPETEFRLGNALMGVVDFRIKTPYGYNTRGPMCFIDGYFDPSSTASPFMVTQTRNRKRARIDEHDEDRVLIERLLRSGVAPRNKQEALSFMNCGSLLEIGYAAQWVFLLDKHVNIDDNSFDVGLWNDDRRLPMTIDPNSVKRIATSVPTRLLDKYDTPSGPSRRRPRTSA